MSLTPDLELAGVATQLLGRLFLALDSSDYAGVAACFGADGLWHRQRQRLTGAAEIVAALAQRPRGRKTLHVITNIVATSKGPHAGTASFYLTAYRHDGVPEESGPAPIVTPTAMGPCEARFVLVSGQWRVAELKTGPDYMFKAMPG